jgi:hypothetical protein
MLSNLSDLLMSRVEPSAPAQQMPTQQPIGMAPAQMPTIPQGQYLQASDKGKPKKTPKAVLDWLNQMETGTGAFAPDEAPIEIKTKIGKEPEVGPIWAEYKTKLGGAKILEGIRMPDGTIDTNHPDVGLVDYGMYMNPSGASQDKTRMSRATKNEAGNWVYRNPVNPNKTHEYIKVKGSQESPAKVVTDYGIQGEWSSKSLPMQEQVSLAAKQAEWQKYYKEKEKKK